MTDTNEGAEWVVYRLTNGDVNAVPRKRMEMYIKSHKQTWDALVEEVVAEGLTCEQALMLRSLTKET